MMIQLYITSGAVLLQSNNIDNSVEPTAIDVKGNYGVSFVWSDGHYADIFPFDVIKKIALDVQASIKR